MTERISLVISDDHPVVRSGLRGMLESQPDFDVVAEASNGAEAVESVGRFAPDVVLMDVRMPKMDGVAATEKIKADYPQTEVLILTTYNSDVDILRAVEKGATGYLLKDAPHEQIFDAVRSAAKGDSALSAVVASRLLGRLRTGPDDLSKREVEVLQSLTEGKNNKEIAEKLWISEATVKSHLNRAYQKLGAADRTGAIIAALKRGIIRLP